MYEWLVGKVVKNSVGGQGSTTKQTPKRLFTPILLLMVVTELALPDQTKMLSIVSVPSPASKLLYSEPRALKPQANKVNNLTPAGERIFAILRKHLKGDGTAKVLIQDLRSLSNYYQDFPEVITLIEELSGKNWALAYSPGAFKTQINGSGFSFESATILFDPRTAAKLKFYSRCDDKKPFCVSSPADALLHELLHVESIINNTDRFIRQGGLSRYNYPHQHEQEIIAKENVLYRAMSRRDGMPRPIRNDHYGKLLMVACATCLE